MNKNRSPIKTIFVILICACLVFTILPRIKKIIELNNQKEALQQKKMVLLQENRNLQNEYKEAQSPEHIEKLAREELGLVKDGEGILIQVED